MTRFGLLIVVLLAATGLQAQEEESNPLVISGSVDAYFKYDFSGAANIGTSFADEHNSVSLGMIDLALEKTVGKSSFMAELAFGPRNVGSAGPVSDGAGYFPRIQNLYMSHAFNDMISITGGYMGTFVGYEIISPTGNFNYSTSYLFTNGPFQNAGVKLDFTFSDRVGLMVGAFNQWNVYTADPRFGPTSLGAQLYLAPVDGWDVYLNAVTGGNSPTEFDLTTTWQLTDAFMLGVNAATYSDAVSDSLSETFTGAALYANVALSDGVALGLRYEYFQSNFVLLEEDASVNAITLSANIGNGALTLIPELRYDLASKDIFSDASGLATSGAAQAVIAAVFAF